MASELVNEYFEKAFQGDAQTQTALGTYYMGDDPAMNGYFDALGEEYYSTTGGVANEPNYKEALYWFQKAADQGYAQAQVRLGDLYRYGNGVDADPTKAAYWYKKAADQGYDIAMESLGELYVTGNGVPQNTNLGFELMEKAAAQGNPHIQYSVGLAYDQVLNNYTKAEYWLQKAVDGEEPGARRNLDALRQKKKKAEQEAEEKERLRQIRERNEKRDISMEKTGIIAALVFLAMSRVSIWSLAAGNLEGMAYILANFAVIPMTDIAAAFAVASFMNSISEVLTIIGGIVGILAGLSAVFVLHDYPETYGKIAIAALAVIVFLLIRIIWKRTRYR